MVVFVIMMMIDLFVNILFTMMPSGFKMFVVPAAMVVFVMMLMVDLIVNISFTVMSFRFNMFVVPARLMLFYFMMAVSFSRMFFIPVMGK